MAQIELIMPKMGESIMEATILKWLKKEGEPIEEEESVLEIATDKVDSEVPSPVEGVLKKILFAEGDTVEVGKTIALIETEAAAGDASSNGQAVDMLVEEKEVQPAISMQESVSTNINIAPQHTPAVSNVQNIPQTTANNGFYSPLVKNIAKQENISVQELSGIPGTGKDQRLTKKDMLAYVQNRTAAPKTTSVVPQTNDTVATARKTFTPPAVSVSGNVEIQEMDRMRRLIADHMVMSKQVSPHVTSYVEVDVSNIVKWRNKVKNPFLQREGEKLTFTPIFVEACIKALKDFPLVNASVDGYNIVIRKDINIGIATATPSGNLIVPVVKNADYLSMTGLAKSINDLANRARTNKLKPEEIQGGTFTVSNIGNLGSLMGTPIINQPQVAIIAIGMIRKIPAVVETEYGDVIAIRQKMFMSLSYDHRLVDGALGSMYLKRVADYLEDFDVTREV